MGFEKCFVDDLDADFSPEIISTNRKSDLFILKYLPIKKRFEIQKSGLGFELSEPELIQDINHIGVEELIFSVRQQSMRLITNCELNPIARLASSNSPPLLFL